MMLHFPAWPTATAADEAALLSARPDLKNGPACEAFAKAFAQFCEVPYALPCANGTVSLELILRALEIGPGDEVILPPYTFIATFSSIVYAGAVPVFADIDPETYNLSASSAAQKISPRTKAIVAVAVAGRPMDIDALEELCRDRDLYLIVDAAQAVGAEWKGRSIGSYGTCASFSCQNTKNLTAGEAGIITTANPSLFRRLRELIGLSEADGPLLDHGLTEQQAALLLSQLSRLPEQIARRSENALYLRSRLEKNPLFSPMKEDPRITADAYHLFLMRLNTDFLQKSGFTRADVCRMAADEGLSLAGGYAPLYTLPAVRSDETARLIGEAPDLSPLPVCERASFEEGCWIEQFVLLSDKETLYLTANLLDRIAASVERGREPSALEKALYSGVWGTIGPYQKEAERLLSEKCGAEGLLSAPYCLLTHGGTSALDAALRALKAPHEKIYVSKGASRIVSSAPRALFAEVVTKIDPNTSLKAAIFDLDAAEEPHALSALSSDTACLVYVPKKDALAFLSKAASAPSSIASRQGLFSKEPLCLILDLGFAAALLTSSERLYLDAFAVHHCGHRPGVGATVDFSEETVLGGDMRVSEWQAIEIIRLLTDGTPR